MEAAGTPQPQRRPQHCLCAVGTLLLLLTAVEVYQGPLGSPLSARIVSLARATAGTRTHRSTPELHG